MLKVLFESLLFAIGCLVFLLSLSSDLFYQGSPGIGFHQLIGMVIGLIFLVIGFKYVLLLEKSMREWLLFLIYLICIFFVGLWPNESLNIHQNFLFGADTFSKRDFVFNVIGFIPLGFLMLPLQKHFIRNNQKMWLVAVAAIIGLSASLVIETFQYLWISGRFSSVYDLAANTFGMVIGAVCYVLLRDCLFIPRKI